MNGKSRMILMSEKMFDDLAEENESLHGQLEEARALLAEAYPGEHPTNRWRQRVEALGAWPVRPTSIRAKLDGECEPQ